MNAVTKSKPSNLIGKHSKLILRLAAPMAGSRFIQMLTGFIGMLMLAHLGPAVLSASALMNACQIAITVFFISILFSMGVVTGRLFGENKRGEIGALVQQGLLFSLMLVVPIMLCYLYVSDVLLWLNEPASLVKYVREFFHGFVWTTLPLCILIVLQQFCYGVLKQRIVIICNTICLALFVPMAHFLIFGALGTRGFGVAGYGYAVAAQLLLNVMLLVFIFIFSPEFKVYQLFKRHHHQGVRYVKQLIKIGWPMGVQFGGELLSLFIVTIFVGWIGAVALAATQITQQILLLFLVPLFAVSESAGILVSQSVGEQRFSEVRMIGSLCVGIGLLFVALFSTIMLLFPEKLTAIYINVHEAANTETVKLAERLFVLVALMLLFDTMKNLSSGALRGLYDTKYSMWVVIIMTWLVGVPTAYLFGFIFHWGVLGVCAGNIVGVICGAILLWRRWRYMSSKYQP